MIRTLRILTLLSLAVAIAVTFLYRPSRPLDDFGELGAFAFQSQLDQPITERNFDGKIAVYACFFTCCTESCPVLSGNVAKLQSELKDLPDLRFVSLTVDPEHDTPAKLTAYAETFGADPQRWLFLTGPRERVEAFVMGQLKQGVEENKGPDRTPGNKMLHSNLLTLVDRQGRIRGFFRGNEADGVDELKAAIRKLH